MDFLGGDPPLAALLDDPLFHLPALPENSSLRIPPLQDPVPFHAHSRPSPLEPSAGGDREAQNSKAKLSSQKGIQKSAANRTETTTGGYDATGTAHSRLTNQQLPKTALPLTISLRTLEKKVNDLFDGEGPRKRVRLDDAEKTPDFVKLPKPHARAQKEQQMPTFGPFTILNGLVEPPPNAALLPPIEPDSLKPSIPSIAETALPMDPVVREKTKEPEPSDDKHAIRDSTPPYSLDANKTRARRKFCKWTTQETNDLLQGVAKFGIGNWKLILEHPEYRFSNRKPTDLKDRFRVCCPDAYLKRTKDKTTVSPSGNPQRSRRPDAPPQKVSVSAIHTSNILLPQSPSPILEPAQPPTPSDVPLSSTNSKSKSHVIPTSTLQNLGIKSFTPSARRSRRPFTSDEDNNLLRGIAAHGFAWALIQKGNDQFGLGHRRSTDLRDRIRNKWPEWYAGVAPGPLVANAQAEKGEEKENGKGDSTTAPKNEQTGKGKTNGKENRDKELDRSQAAQVPTLISGSETKSSTAKDIPFGPSDSTQVSMSMAMLTNPLPLGFGMGAGSGYELPAISTAVGDSLHLLNEDGAGAGVDDFDWGDNTLPRLMMWDDIEG
jgi:Myb-like DNA-binding domain